MKVCSVCKINKPLELFNANSGHKDGLDSQCKDCHSIRSKKYYLLNKVLHNERAKKRLKANPESSYLATMKWKHGITKEEYFKLVDDQNGVCAICNKENIKEGNKIRLALDHCHETGLVRGLLCDSCNKGLGNFKDNFMLTDKATNYLRKYNASL